MFRLMKIVNQVTLFPLTRDTHLLGEFSVYPASGYYYPLLTAVMYATQANKQPNGGYNGGADAINVVVGHVHSLNEWHIFMSI